MHDYGKPEADIAHLASRCSRDGTRAECGHDRRDASQQGDRLDGGADADLRSFLVGSDGHREIVLDDGRPLDGVNDYGYADADANLDGFGHRCHADPGGPYPVLDHRAGVVVRILDTGCENAEL